MIDQDLFRAVLGRFASGITVITTHEANGTPHGMTVSAFSSLSLDPPLVMVCIGNDATMAPVMAQATSFAVNVLAERIASIARSSGATSCPCARRSRSPSSSLADHKRAPRSRKT